MAVLLVAARAHREHRGDCAAQQPRASRDYCGAPADPAEVSGRVASPSDGALRGARDAPAPRIAQAGVAMPRGWRRSEWLAPKPSSVLYEWQRAFEAPLVWRLDNYVGLGNALDAYARAAIEASHRKRRLVVHSTIVAKFCAIVRCRLEPRSDPGRPANRRPRTRLHRVRPGGRALRTPNRTRLHRVRPGGRALRTPMDDDGGTVRYSTFGWRNSRPDKGYDGTLADLFARSSCATLVCLRRAILRDLVEDVNGTAAARAGPALRDAFVGGDPAAPSAAAVHLRTLDFIESKNATLRGDAAAAAWLGSRRALQKWTCLARRLRAARLGCGAGDRVFVAADSAVVKRRFAAALRTAFPGVGVGYFDGLAPPIYDTWLKEEPTPGEWLLLAAAAADWLALARSAHVLGLKGTTTGLALPSSFARTATLAFSPATFENLQRLVWSRGDRRVACCVWKDDNDW